jgi:hypothetical protein
MKHIHEVFQCLHTNNIYAKLEKCEFNINTTNFLNFIISPDSLCMDNTKVQVI